MLVDLPNLLQVRPKGLFHYLRQKGDAILLTFAVSDGDLVRCEIDILNPEAQTLHEPQTRSIQQRRHQPLIAGQMTKNGLHLVARPMRRLGFLLGQF